VHRIASFASTSGGGGCKAKNRASRLAVEGAEVGGGGCKAANRASRLVELFQLLDSGQLCQAPKLLNLAILVSSLSGSFCFYIGLPRKLGHGAICSGINLGENA
jgi:hypothetical protein